ncbi:DUF805 domain-containing protein [Oxalicibacterium faecigallinarum]|uniref:DUF805 domain-containing protein n=1 Tax=Oxalicibacterium faecigallinarum TaxID=573741 RepID=A0A8J3AQN8_9BURK|nr:DUF805 domain-containing protein [Oxalicibacterium faecigallinarum]GGI18518.1 hypothetical protein GCM10008066_14420 [Oxalicibacterium faecigallinarum]
MTSYTPYLSPPDNTPPVERIRPFSLAGRLDRWRYVAFALCAIVAVMLILFIAGFALLYLGSLGRMLYIGASVVLCYAFLPIFLTILTIKRCHDFNMGGWLAVLLLVPVVNLAFCFIPGTKEENKYGLPLPVPSAGTRAIAIILPILLIGGFLATGTSQLSDSSNATSSPASTTLQSYQP